MQKSYKPRRSILNHWYFYKKYHLPAYWINEEEVEREFNKLTSELARKEVVKLKINIRTKGFGWKKMLHAWSKGGYVYNGN